MQEEKKLNEINCEQAEILKSLKLNYNLVRAMINNIRKTKKSIRKQIHVLASNVEVRSNLGEEAAEERIRICKKQEALLTKQFNNLEKFYKITSLYMGISESKGA